MNMFVICKVKGTKASAIKPPLNFSGKPSGKICLNVCRGN